MNNKCKDELCTDLVEGSRRISFNKTTSKYEFKLFYYLLYNVNYFKS